MLNIPKVPLLTAKRATDLYGVPDGDPHGAWAREHIVYCGGNGKAPRPTMPGVPAPLWFAVHKRAEPKVRAAFAAAQKACPGYVIGSSAAWVYRHMNRPDLAKPPLSIHSWAAAVDTDAPRNGLRTRTIVPYSADWIHEYPAGLPQAWVEGFCSVGGIDWGGAWRGLCDPMHASVYDPEG